MAYTEINFKTKKELKEAVKQYNENINKPQFHEPIRCFQPGLGPDLSDYTGIVYLEGSHYPKPHKWYAQAKLENGIVVKVK